MAHQDNSQAAVWEALHSLRLSLQKTIMASRKDGEDVIGGVFQSRDDMRKAFDGRVSAEDAGQPSPQESGSDSDNQRAKGALPHTDPDDPMGAGHSPYRKVAGEIGKAVEELLTGRAFWPLLALSLIWAFEWDGNAILQDMEAGWLLMLGGVSLIAVNLLRKNAGAEK